MPRGKGGGRRSGSERRMRTVLARYERSGLSLRAFAEAQGIPAGTLSWWKSEIRKRDERERERAAEAGDALIPLTVVSSGGGLEEAAAWQTTEGFAVELPNGCRLRVPPTFQAASLEDLVRILSRA